MDSKNGFLMRFIGGCLLSSQLSIEIIDCEGLKVKNEKWKREMKYGEFKRICANDRAQIIIYTKKC